MLSFVVVLFFAGSIFYITYVYFMTKRMSEIERGSQAKSLFIQKLGYELRSPLNGILGFTEMLEGGFFGELNLRQRERLKDINRCGMEISRVIEDVLDLSYTGSAGVELVKSRFSVNEMLARSLDPLDSKLKLSEVVLAKHINCPEAIILGDKHKLVFALRHIIDNAIKFSKRGGQITITDEVTGGGILYITVADTGHGMSADEVKSAFLYPDDESKTKNPNGIGMGLPLSQLFLQLHGGNIRIESATEIGTTVIMALPLI